eukprot:GEMP01058529.1.p1 GENE.GEMP01058529.1~~GEMP01058529.1.p1  ORF type:complete len:190 (+),score=30.73 GEMP01058529.1:214-783(+)
MHTPKHRLKTQLLPSPTIISRTCVLKLVFALMGQYACCCANQEDRCEAERAAPPMKNGEDHVTTEEERCSPMICACSEELNPMLSDIELLDKDDIFFTSQVAEETEEAEEKPEEHVRKMSHRLSADKSSRRSSKRRLLVYPADKRNSERSIPGVIDKENRVSVTSINPRLPFANVEERGIEGASQPFAS